MWELFGILQIIIFVLISIALVIFIFDLIISPLMIWRNTNTTNALLVKIIKELQTIKEEKENLSSVLNDVVMIKSRINWSELSIKPKKMNKSNNPSKTTINEDIDKNIVLNEEQDIQNGPMIAGNGIQNTENNL